MVQALAAAMPARHPQGQADGQGAVAKYYPKRETLHGNTLVPVREQIMELSVAQ